MYTPEFSYREGVSIRRLAWSLDLPMTKIMKEIVSLLPSLFSSAEVCAKCKDKTKCEDCAFNKENTAANKVFIS